MDQETARTLLQEAVEPRRPRRRRRPVLWCTLLFVFLLGLGGGLVVLRLS